MPVWAWLGFVVFIALNSRLPSLAQETRSLRSIVYSAEGSPAYFWFFVIVFVLSGVFLAVFFGLLMLTLESCAPPIPCGHKFVC